MTRDLCLSARYADCVPGDNVRGLANLSLPQRPLCGLRPACHFKLIDHCAFASAPAMRIASAAIWRFPAQRDPLPQRPLCGLRPVTQFSVLGSNPLPQRPLCGLRRRRHTVLVFSRCFASAPAMRIASLQSPRNSGII